MREIKFRAWSKYTEKMVYPSETGWYERVFMGDNGYLQTTSLSGFLNREDVVPMQYTGLKDKNGREIYEGDLYSYTISSEIGIGGKVIKTSEITHVKPVEFKEGAFYHGEELLADVIQYDDTFTFVGNIHENPELLEREWHENQ